MKWLGPLARLIQWIGTTFLGWKLARDRQAIKKLKSDVATRERIDDAETTDDPAIARELLADRKRKRSL